MSKPSVRVTSIETIRTFRGVLLRFQEEVGVAITSLELESRRPLDWIEHDRSRYWPREVRKASDVLSEARIALERCELTSTADEHRSCYDERKQLEKAKRRLALAESKVQIVIQWRNKLRKEVEEFLVQSAKLKHYLDHDLPRATALLGRLSEALDRYVEANGANGAKPGSSTVAEVGSSDLEAGKGSGG